MNAEWTLIDWVEHKARENLKARLAAIDHLASQANSLLYFFWLEWVEHWHMG